MQSRFWNSRPPITLAMSLLLACLQASLAPGAEIGGEPSAWVPMRAQLRDVLDSWDRYFHERWLARGITPPRGSGYKPYQRWKWLVERRLDDRGAIDPTARWTAFQQSKARRSSALSGTSEPEWTNLGPFDVGGRMLSHAFDPNDPRILWAGSASGGLWRTRDGGESWEPMTDHLPSLAVPAVAIHPTDPDTMLIATGEGFGGYTADGVGVLRSTDGGATWTQTSFEVPMAEAVGCFALAWNPISTDIVFLAAGNGLWISADAGSHWLLARPGRFVSVVIDRQNPQRVYAAQAERDPPTALNVLYRSLDGGLTWNAMSGGLPQQIGFTSLSICDAAPNVLYASIDQSDPQVPTLYKSVDGGDTWRALDGAPKYLCYPAPWVGCQGFFANVVAVSPGDPNLVFAGGIHLYRSTDGGATWEVSGGLYPDMAVHVDHHSFAYHPSEAGVIYSFNDGGVYRSRDLGATWEAVNRGLATFQYYGLATSPFDPTRMSGGSQDNGTRFLDFAGSDPTTRMWGPYADGGISLFDHQRNGVIHGEEQVGTHFKSTDGGATWRYAMNGITEPGPWITPVAMDPHDADILYTSSRSAIYRSTDAGENWQRVSAATQITSLAIDRFDPSVVYAGSFFDASLLRSRDRGLTWTRVPAPWIFGLSDLEVDPNVPGMLYATMGSYSARPRVFRSADWGTTWSSITGDLPVIPTNCVTPGPPGDLFVGTDLGVYRTTSGGTHWDLYNGNLPNVMVFDMHYVSADSTLRVGTHGRGAWSVRLAPPPTLSVSPDAEGPGTLGRVHPNPFTAETHIGYLLERTSAIRVAVYDLAGRVVRVLAEGTEEPGARDLRWDGNDAGGTQVPSGVYFCSFEARTAASPGSAVTKYQRILKLR